MLKLEGGRTRSRIQGMFPGRSSVTKEISIKLMKRTGHAWEGRKRED